MLAATTLAAAMALMTEAGPLAQSPPAKTPGMFSKSPVLLVMIFPLWTGTPASSKWLVSISWPMARISTSQGIYTSGSPVGWIPARPSFMALTIWGVAQIPRTRPFSSTSMEDGAFKVKSSIPSATAPSISSGRAVISWRRLRYRMLTFSAPMRFAVRTASMDTLPPPTTTTCFPVRSGSSPRPALRKNSTADSTPSASSWSRRSFLSALAPMAMRMASYSFWSSWMVMSFPIFNPCFTWTPVFKILRISSSSRSLGRR